MNWKQVIGCGVLLSSQLGCAAGEEQSDSRGGSEEAALALGAYGPKVLEVRRYLTEFGYFPNEELQSAFPAWRPMVPETTLDPANFDEPLEAALSKYQRNMGLDPSGRLDEATAEAMRHPRCGVPDSDPAGAQTVDKWAWFGPETRWTKTTLRFRIAQPNVVLQGMGTKEATRAAIVAGLDQWAGSTNLTFQEVTSGEDFVIDYRQLAAGTVASANPLPSPIITINSRIVFNATTLKLAAAHESGHVIGLHHSSNFISGGPRPLMAPTGNTTGTLLNDDRIAANARYNDWEQLPGLAHDIGIGVGGAVWIVGQGARQPFFWNGSGWVEAPLPGVTGSRIDVDSRGRPWLVSSSNVIYRRDGSTWITVPGNGRALDIGCGPNDSTVYALGLNGQIFKHVNDAWSLVGGPVGSTSLDVDMAGSPHVIASNGEIWACGASCGRVATGGAGLDIGFGGPPGSTLGVENWAWLIGLGDGIWVRNRQAAIPGAPESEAPARDEWVNVSGSARRVSVGPNGRPWVVAANGNIYRRRELL